MKSPHTHKKSVYNLFAKKQMKNSCLLSTKWRLNFNCVRTWKSSLSLYWMVCDASNRCLYCFNKIFRRIMSVVRLFRMEVHNSFDALFSVHSTHSISISNAERWSQFKLVWKTIIFHFLFKFDGYIYETMAEWVSVFANKKMAISQFIKPNIATVSE